MKFRRCMLVLFVCPHLAQAQSLMRDPASTPPDATAATPPAQNPAGGPALTSEQQTAIVQAPLRGYSLTQVEPPPPHTFALHDLITIIVSETSRQSADSKLDTKTDASISGEINKLPDFQKLLEFQLATGDSSPEVELDASGKNKFKGDGKYERTDRFTDKVTAEIIDIRPNGTLVLEARRSIGKDKEFQTLVLAGSCRREDVTTQNTVLSSQLADLTLDVQNDGEVKNTASKGWLTRVFETIFDF